ncbi:hypothetical protein ACWN9M_04280 [Leuconostoc lactis]
MKFTEEQFKQLVKIQEKYFPHNVLELGVGAVTLWGTIKSNDRGLYEFITYHDLENQAAALMNPVTREWAYEQFVEKEKKYMWNSKKTDKAGHCMRLYRNDHLIITGATANYSDEVYDDAKLTESEVKAWGYNPEMFDKEEVE